MPPADRNRTGDPRPGDARPTRGRARVGASGQAAVGRPGTPGSGRRADRGGETNSSRLESGGPGRPRRRVRLVRVAVALVVLGLGVNWVVGAGAGWLAGGDGPSGVAAVPTAVAEQAPEVERTVDVHAGYGAWVDVYDYLPSGSSDAPVSPETVDEMAERGVSTLYLQAARYEAGEPGQLVEPDAVAEMLVRAHLVGMRVVGWYLPTFTDIDRDLDYLTAISDFEVLGHRFDGVAADIEWTNDVVDHKERSRKLVKLSQRLRETAGDDALGAIVLPPVQLEVINEQKWPKFPWDELADLYDVWLPMGYWTERREDSGYKDGHTYTTENVDRLRENLDDPDAVIHAVGGIGDEITRDQAQAFADAVADSNVIGGSIYDWATLDPRVSDQLAADLTE